MNFETYDTTQKEENKTQLSYRKVQGVVGERSFSIILPKIFATNLGIGKGDFVKVSLEGMKIIVERAE